MSGKEKFIETIEKLIEDVPDLFGNNEADAAAALKYFHSLKENKSEDITEKAKNILDFMVSNKDKYSDCFSAKDIGDSLGISSRSITGSMRALVNNNYVTKEGKNPVIYHLAVDNI